MEEASDGAGRIRMATLNIKGFPDDLHEALRGLAEREHRSLAQQVIHMLAAAVEDGPVVSILELRGLGRTSWDPVEPARQVERERSSWD